MTKFTAYVCPLCCAWTHDPKATSCVGGTNGTNPSGTSHEMTEREVVELIPRSVADGLAYEVQMHLFRGYDERYLLKALNKYKSVV